MTKHAPLTAFASAVLAAAALLFVPLSALPTTAKPEDVGLSAARLQRVREAIQRHIVAGDISGAVTLVARKGKVAHLEAHGQMDLETKKAMPVNAVFRMASMTKPIVGAAIMMMVEEGRVRLTDPVSRFIPEFKTLKVAVEMPRPAGPAAPATAEVAFYTVPAAREITVRDLLTHTSGLVSGGVSATEAAKVQKTPADTLATYLPRLAAVPLAFQPGSRWTYSPSIGFETLGRIVEVASGQTLDRFLKQRIFDPLGMKDTFFYGPQDRQVRVPVVYQRAPEGMVIADNPDRNRSALYFAGGGGLLGTAEDYVEFAQMLLNGGQSNGRRLLGPRTIEWMRAVHVPDTLPGRQPGRSFGLSVQVVSNPVAAGQSVSAGSYGWDGAFGTHFWIDPKEQLVGIMMVQTANPNRQVDRDFENAVMQAIVE